MKAFLDANLPYSITKTDLLLTVAQAKFFDVAWSTYVEQEALDHLVGTHEGGDREERILRRFTAMNTAFPGAGHRSKPLTTRTVRLRDRDDEQVLFDACEAGATQLVTENVRDFVASPPSELPLAVMSGDNFLLALISVQTAASFSIILDDWRAARSAPAQSRDEVVALLQRQTWVGTAAVLREVWP